MNAPSDDIRTLLESDSSLGLVFQTNLFIGIEPDQPNECVTIFDTPGSSPQLTMNRGEIYEYPSIQIRVRATEYLEGWGMIEDVKDFLHGRSQEQLNGTLYTAIICSISPFLLDYDQNRRPRFVVNFNLQRC
jgi:hypothetical protein